MSVVEAVDADGEAEHEMEVGASKEPRFLIKDRLLRSATRTAYFFFLLSRSEAVRLKTKFSADESLLSTQKYPSRSNW